MQTLLKRALWTINFTLITVCGLLVVAVHIPGIPYLGHFGSVIIPLWTPWFIVMPLTIESLVLWRAGKKSRRSAQVLFASSLAIAAGSSTVLLKMIHTAHAAGVRIDTLDLFGFETVRGETGPDETVSYGSIESGPLLLAVYRPKRVALERAAPILIDIHGGGWIGGTMTDHDQDLRWFADQGWLVISPEYTLSTSTLHLWNSTIDQIGCAMAWVSIHGNRFGGDTNLISVSGKSAGGNLAINAAYMANHGILKSSCGGLIPHVRSVVATYPVVDPAGLFNSSDAMLSRSARDMTSEYTGGTPLKYPERYAAISSTTYLTPDSPPTLIFVGESDHLVPPEPTYRFAHLAKNAGVEIRLIRFPYGEHGFDGNVGSIGNQLVRKATLQYLQDHLQTP